MNDLIPKTITAIDKHKLTIVCITIAIASLAVLKELIFPSAYSADKLLVVTNMDTGGETAKLVPIPFSPSTYRDLLRSTSLLGRVRGRLIDEGVWEEDDAPLLDIFREQLNVVVSVVDETTRPINYSPVIRLTALGESEAEVIAIADMWANEGIEMANGAVSLRIMGAAAALYETKKGYETALTDIWESQRKETAEFNLTVLGQKMTTQLTLLDKLVQQRSTLRLQRISNKEGLRAIREDLLDAIESEEADFKSELDTLHADLEAETAESNVTVLQKDMEVQLVLAHQALQAQVTARRDLVMYERQLAAVNEQLEAEPFPFLDVYKAPVELAIWNAFIQKDSGKSLKGLEKSVMVGQELNTTYWDAKKQEQSLLSLIAGHKAQLEILETQFKKAESEQQALEKELAAHKGKQDQITTDITRGTDRYSKMGTTELLALKKLERETLMREATLDFELKETEEQIAAVSAEQKALEESLAEHTITQQELATREGIAKAIFSDIATGESFVVAAAALASGKASVGEEGVGGEGEAMAKTVGLNLLSRDTYAIEDKGMLGRRGRVMVTTFLAFFLSTFAFWFKEVGVPLYQDFLNQALSSYRKAAD